MSDKELTRRLRKRLGVGDDERLVLDEVRTRFGPDGTEDSEGLSSELAGWNARAARPGEPDWLERAAESALSDLAEQKGPLSLALREPERWARTTLVEHGFAADVESAWPLEDAERRRAREVGPHSQPALALDVLEAADRCHKAFAELQKRKGAEGLEAMVAYLAKSARDLERNFLIAAFKRDSEEDTIRRRQRKQINRHAGSKKRKLPQQADLIAEYQELTGPRSVRIKKLAIRHDVTESTVRNNLPPQK